MPANKLSAQQLDLLHQILRTRSGIPRNGLDGRTLKALEGRELVEQDDGLVRATERARSEYRLVPDRVPSESQKKLSDAQYEMLRRLIHSREPVPDDALDARTAKALIERGLAIAADGTLAATTLGKELHSRHTHAPPQKRSRKNVDPRSHVVLRAIADLRRVIPVDSELAVGPMFCHVDDLLDGFQRWAKRRQEGRG